MKARLMILIAIVLLNISCERNPQIVQLMRCNWVESRLITDTDTIVLQHAEDSPHYMRIELSDRGDDFVWFYYNFSNSDSVARVGCQVPNYDLTIEDFSNCANNERCFNTLCGDSISMVPWNGDTVRVIGWGWNGIAPWTGTACNEIHLYTYEEESYEY
ncbi:MAG: hypothetical protein ACKVOK_04315 [Flavobacteriales bacterium]